MKIEKKIEKADEQSSIIIIIAGFLTAILFRSIMNCHKHPQLLKSEKTYNL